jgi:hypothetical protein
MARCAKRAVAIQPDCFVAPLLAMTAHDSRSIGMSDKRRVFRRPLVGGIAGSNRDNKRIALVRSPH